ncbi:MAG: gamma-glutamylcyclotransferase [Legionellales bacterium]|nr:gamma-glutamylcyclotransferase [Legionellales bacterium]
MCYRASKYAVIAKQTLKLVFIVIWTSPSFGSTCHPQTNTKLPQYVVGYGSLIDEQSKKRTDPTAEESFPALIKGYKRSWSVHGNLPGLNATFLSIIKEEHASFNGVVYKLSKPENIRQYDKRETTYCREELNADRLKMYSGTLSDKKQIWIYSAVQKLNEYPTHDIPIAQSYVDIFIRGCIQIEEKFKIPNFAKDCIRSTDQWSEHWENDRIFPRRPSFYEPYAAKIDALLKELLPEKFKSIKLE